MLGNILQRSKVVMYAWLKVFSMFWIVGRATVQLLTERKSTVALYKVLESFCCAFLSA